LTQKQKKQKEPMSPCVLLALRESIAHWKRMLVGKERPGERPDGRWCSLCKLFDEGEYGECLACPVRQKTGFRGCHGSPYWRAFAAYHAFCSGRPDTEREWKIAAKLQIAFLESLLPKKRKARSRG
jgi:hypothetical protein